MFGDNMKRLRKAAGISQAEVASRVHVSAQAVSKWENNKSTPSPEMVSALASLLGISADELLGSGTVSGTLRIPVLGSVPAGIPIEAIEDVIGFEDVPSNWGNGGREYFALQVNGDSMYPEYLDGDIVIVRKQSVADTGDDVVIYVNGYDATLKRFRLNPDGSLSIIPINPQYAPRTFTPEEIQEMPVSIAGVVVELRRTKKR